jgi:hypothetical protein
MKWRLNNMASIQSYVVDIAQLNVIEEIQGLTPKQRQYKQALQLAIRSYENSLLLENCSVMQESTLDIDTIANIGLSIGLQFVEKKRQEKLAKNKTNQQDNVPTEAMD